MKHCCATCANQYIIERLDYTEEGCQHSYENGFACGAVLDEGIMYHMVGNDPNVGNCEMWRDRDDFER